MGRSVPERMSSTSCGINSSASPNTKWSMSGKSAWPVVNRGPPAMIGLPRRRQRSTMLVHGFFVHNHRGEHHVIRPPHIAVRQTAHVEVDQLELPVGRQLAATVNRPRGGNAARFETKRNTCLKLQNVSGVGGLISSIFMACYSNSLAWESKTPQLHVSIFSITSG